MRIRWRLALPAVLLAGTVAGAGYRLGLFGTQGEPGAIRVSGNIEITDVEVSFKLAGCLLQRAVSEGHFVKAGAPVAELDASELGAEAAIRRADVGVAQAVLAELEAGSRIDEVAEARAALEKAQAQLAELEAGSRPQEIAVAEAVVARAEAELFDAETDYNRLRALYEQQVAADREIDSARASYGVARARLREVQEQLKLVQEGPRAEQIAQARAATAQVHARYELVEQGPREEAIEQARAKVAQAEAGLRLAETRLGYARVVAPLSGIVLSENVEPGEFVAPGTAVVTIGDMENVWLRAYVSETDLGRVKVGQRVRVKADTWPEKVYEGRVSFIASQAEFTPKNVQTQEERVKLVYRIKIDIPNPDMELKPGMPADAEIMLDESGGV